MKKEAKKVQDTVTELVELIRCNGPFFVRVPNGSVQRMLTPAEFGDNSAEGLFGQVAAALEAALDLDDDALWQEFAPADKSVARPAGNCIWLECLNAMLAAKIGADLYARDLMDELHDVVGHVYAYDDCQDRHDPEGLYYNVPESDVRDNQRFYGWLDSAELLDYIQRGRYIYDYEAELASKISTACDENDACAALNFTIDPDAAISAAAKMAAANGWLRGGEDKVDGCWVKDEVWLADPKGTWYIAISDNRFESYDCESVWDFCEADPARPSINARIGGTPGSVHNPVLRWERGRAAETVHIESGLTPCDDGLLQIDYNSQTDVFGDDGQRGTFDAPFTDDEWRQLCETTLTTGEKEIGRRND